VVLVGDSYCAVCHLGEVYVLENMEDPYQSPEIQEDLKTLEKKRGCKEPAVGCGVGGCAIPIVLFIIIPSINGSRGVGGPFFYLFTCFILGLVGLLIGIIVRAAR